MADPVTTGTLAAAALSAGASALGKGVVSAAVTEAYATLKAAVARGARRPDYVVSLTQLIKLIKRKTITK